MSGAINIRSLDFGEHIGSACIAQSDPRPDIHYDHTSVAEAQDAACSAREFTNPPPPPLSGNLCLYGTLLDNLRHITGFW